VKTEKHPPAPVAPETGKAQIVFVGQVDSRAMGACIGCNTFTTTRVGVDGSWVGATKANSYFALDVAPGEHHLCAYWKSIQATRGKNVAVTSFSAEAGQVYYFQVMIKDVEGAVMGESSVSNWVLDLTPLSEDEGKYRVKISPLAAATPKK